jgi:hypothetical protein
MPLHTVIYAKYDDNVQSQHRRSYKDWLVDQWLEENCIGMYFHNPGWTTEKYIQFERSEDAVHFSLRWAQ